MKSWFNGSKLKSWSQKSDDDLMQGIKEGDEAAFNVLFERHGSKVLGLAKKLLGNLDRAEETSQEIWMKVVRQAENYVSQGSFSSWVMMMTKNHCLNILRKDKRLQFSETPEDHASIENLDSLEESLFRKFDIEELSLALQALPERQRVALTLLATEEPSYEDLAEDMGLSLGALKSVIHRGRKALKESLENNEEVRRSL